MAYYIEFRAVTNSVELFLLLQMIGDEVDAYDRLHNSGGKGAALSATASSSSSNGSGGTWRRSPHVTSSEGVYPGRRRRGRESAGRGAWSSKDEVIVKNLSSMDLGRPRRRGDPVVGSV